MRSARVVKLQGLRPDGRLLGVKILFLAGGLVLIGRLFVVQVVQRQAYQAMAKPQHVSQSPISAQRGLIYDRFLNVLALNEPCISIGVDLRMIDNRRQCAQKIAPLVGESVATLSARMEVQRGFVWLKRQVDLDVAEKIRSLNLVGVRVEKDSRRRYPRGDLASHVIGHTDIDNRGIAGVELAQDELLQGQNGLRTWQRDALGNRLPDIGVPTVHAVHGKSVVLTIDHVLQTIAAEELRNSIEMFEASGGIVIIANPSSGEIRAIDCMPGFDPNRAGAYSVESRRNRAVADLYEPGSTFKIVTFSGVLQEKLLTPEDIIFCENGKMKIYDHEVRDVKNFGRLRVREILQHSSNIGAIKLAQILGSAKLYQYARDFGFGVQSQLNLDGEAAGVLKHPVEWSGFTRAAIAMGYEVSVTALQMVMAYSAIANGGMLLEPQIVAGFIDAEGQPPPRVEPKPVRRVISRTVARALAAMLEGVVEQGTGRPAGVEGVRIAGKTGTARKPLSHGLGYSREDYNSSFIGFFPANEPKHLVFVLLENPRTTYWGGMVAAPTFRRIVQRMLRHVPQEQRRPDGQLEAAVDFRKVRLPDLTNRPAALAAEILRSLDLRPDWEGAGDFVISQRPTAGSLVAAGSSITLSLFEVAAVTRDRRLPNVVGMTLREALRRLSIAGVATLVHGSGVVHRQWPAAGTPIRSGMRCQLDCQSSPVAATISSAVLQ